MPSVFGHKKALVHTHTHVYTHTHTQILNGGLAAPVDCKKPHPVQILCSGYTVTNSSPPTIFCQAGTDNSTASDKRQSGQASWRDAMNLST